MGSVLLLIRCLAALAAPARAQTPGRILRPHAVLHSVADLERSVAFYRDAVGLTMEALGGAPMKPERPVAVASRPVSIDGTTRAFVRDLNGLLLEFVEAGT